MSDRANDRDEAAARPETTDVERRAAMQRLLGLMAAAPAAAILFDPAKPKAASLPPTSS